MRVVMWGVERSLVVGIVALDAKGPSAHLTSALPILRGDTCGVPSYCPSDKRVGDAGRTSPTLRLCYCFSILHHIISLRLSALAFILISFQAEGLSRLRDKLCRYASVFVYSTHPQSPNPPQPIGDPSGSRGVAGGTHSAGSSKN